ncbi:MULTISPECIES: HlyD family secretion protein [unclassified Moritella]|uniref:HlyD family secretion protein n=1 Tax=unclassified Moritella TaxID=2637987 RepID=UPI001BA9B5ED|nr:MULTISPECIES: HlyD family secretion protein [unclassified Moritella]QUM85710.1 HlyD family secretion protein [Moritella sp. 28]QUM89926.1 HlyD family secretion protein [Moritella sp. 36]
MKHIVYKSIIYAVLAVTIGFSAFLVTSDNALPFTTQASLHKNVANIAPEVTGVITQVYVENGQHVHTGERLFSLDKAAYKLAVRQAEAELHLAQEANSSKLQTLTSAVQTLGQRQAESNNAHTKLRRYQSLFNKGLITQQDVEDVQLSFNLSKSAVAIAKAEIQRIKSTLSDHNDTAEIEFAIAKLDQAKLALANTDVKAKSQGTVSNLQLQVGSYVAKGSVALFLVNESSSWLGADFNEKGMSLLGTGTKVAVVFDAIPGQVFNGTLLNQDSAIYDASNLTNQLSTVKNDNRWIREQQKIRTRIQVEGIDTALMSGAKASVIVQNSNSLLSAIGYSWITFVSYFRYIY